MDINLKAMSQQTYQTGCAQRCHPTGPHGRKTSWLFARKLSRNDGDHSHAEPDNGGSLRSASRAVRHIRCAKLGTGAYPNPASSR
jgi:hypothetical protein